MTPDVLAQRMYRAACARGDTVGQWHWMGVINHIRCQAGTEPTVTCQATPLTTSRAAHAREQAKRLHRAKAALAWVRARQGACATLDG